MRAAIYQAFGQLPTIEAVPDPTPTPGGAVIRVEATGLCRSDWHGWMGHDPDIRLPHVPGHELAGTIAALGSGVSGWRVGDRVTLPFVCACGNCPQCDAGDQQVCAHQFQPGFTHWGSFAEYVAIDHAAINLVALPAAIGFDTAASLGCRFATAFRAIVAQGRVGAGQWVVVHGCGGVGLSAIMIATALGARVVAVDVSAAALAVAEALGAAATVDAGATDDVVSALRDLTDGGAQVSVDALGDPQTCFDSVACLRPRGKHLQVGLLLADQAQPRLPMNLVIAKELELIGCHGMQAHAYPAMLAMIASGALAPERLIGARIGLDEAPAALAAMDSPSTAGMTIIDRLR